MQVPLLPNPSSHGGLDDRSGFVLPQIQPLLHGNLRPVPANDSFEAPALDTAARQDLAAGALPREDRDLPPAQPPAYEDTAGVALDLHSCPLHPSDAQTDKL
jgi:hypothetical protein